MVSLRIFPLLLAVVALCGCSPAMATADAGIISDSGITDFDNGSLDAGAPAVLLGLRHLESQDGACFTGTIDDARIYGSALTVDQIARPGTMVSGNVTFSDGQSAGWYLDQTGRLGLAAEDKTYRPPPADIAEFQTLLQNELAKLGL